MGDIIFGVDFRAKRRVVPYEESLEQMAARLMDVVWSDAYLADTAPSEYVAPENDPA